MDIVSIRYRSTNYYLVDSGAGVLAFDGGWPNSFPEYRDCLKEKGMRVSSIRWLVVSHFHIDHAGLCGVFAERGVQVVVFENQISAIDDMEALIARQGMPYLRIDKTKLVEKRLDVSREWLRSIGIDGEVIQTDGHGDQSVSLLLDSGIAFTGDLAPEGMVGDFDPRTQSNWATIRAKGMRLTKPAHGAEYTL
jgi:ribonuclease/clavin/mitogillin